MKEWIRKYFAEIITVIATVMILTCGAVYDYSTGDKGGLTLTEMESKVAEFRAEHGELLETENFGGEIE